MPSKKENDVLIQELQNTNAALLQKIIELQEKMGKYI